MASTCPKCLSSWAKCECDITEPDAPAPPRPTSPENPIIPFGKYQGQRAGDVSDVRYLDWLLGVARPPFRDQLSAHLNARADWLALE